MAKKKDQPKTPKAGGDNNQQSGSTATVAPSKTPSPKVERKQNVRSEKGMTCFNWFLVLFLITSASSGIIFALFEKATFLENESNKQTAAIKAVSDRINVLKADKSNAELTDIQSSLKEILKEKNKLQGTLKHVVDKIAELEGSVSSMNKKIFAAETTVKSSENMVNAMNQANDEIKSKQNDIDSKLSAIKDTVAVSDTNVQFLSKELIRLDKLVLGMDEQISKSQNEIITLYSDYVKRQGVDSSDEQINDIKEQVAKSDIRLKVLEEQSAKVVKQSNDEMTRFSGDISDMRRSINDQMQEFSRQVSKDSQTFMQSVVTQIEDSKTGAQSMEKDFRDVQKLVVELNEKMASMDRSGVVEKFSTLLSDLNNLKLSFEKVKSSIKDTEVRTEKQITVLTEHIKAIREDDENMKKELKSLLKQKP